MTDAVDQTLALWRRTTFEWGARDCMLSIGDYIAARGGQDVTGRYRGTYGDEAGAMAHMAAAGGATGLVDATGLRECLERPCRGDVVVIDISGDGIGALCTGDSVAVRLERGVAEISLRFVRIVKAWQCPL